MLKYCLLLAVIMFPKDPKKKVKKMVKLGVILWALGFLMILAALYLEFFGGYAGIADSTSSRLLMTLKLSGVGFSLAGIFWSLIAIVKTLSMMPVELKKAMKKR